MVKIRLRRVGKKKQPIYKIVVADSRSARNAKYIDSLGQYNPLVHPIVIAVTEEKLFKWLNRGAQPTDTVRSLLQRCGLWLKWGLMKKGVDAPAIALAMETWQATTAEKLQREAQRKARRKAARKKASAVDTSAVVSAEPAAAVEAEATPAS